MVRRVLLLAVFALGLGALISVPAAGAKRGVNPLLIKRIVVIYEENHSFDNLYGLWEGVNGLDNADRAHTVQVKQGGTPYACLLQDDVNLSPNAGPCEDSTNGTTFHSIFGNSPFNIDQYIGPMDTTCPATPAQAFAQPNGWLKGTGRPGGCTRDIIHRFYHEQYQLNGGHQNRYVTASDSAGLVMGYYDTTALPIYRYLHRGGHPHYAILDNFFQAAFGGSFLNHQWLIAARTPTAPDTNHSVLDQNGMAVPRYPPASQTAVPLYVSPEPNAAAVLKDTQVTAACPAPLGLACGNFAVNTSQSPSQPHGNGFQIPLQTAPTIGDELSAAGIGWAWYSGGWSNAAGLVGKPGWTNGNGPNCSDPNSFANPAFPYCPNLVFQFHHQPFNYYANFAEGGPLRSHLRDEAEFTNLANASHGGAGCKLEPVSIIKPIAEENEHPGYASEPLGSEHLVDLIQAIENSRCKQNTMIVVTYDEFGGEWDHVPPPGMDGTSGPHDVWGPGTRIPALVLSPYLRGNFVVDHTQYDTTSILATIEDRFGLVPVATRDGEVNDLADVFNAHQVTGQ